MTSFTGSLPARPSAARRHRGLLAMLLALPGLHRQRRDLRDLDTATLRDIGLTRHEADVESRRPVWDVPANWRR